MALSFARHPDISVCALFEYFCKGFDSLLAGIGGNAGQVVSELGEIVVQAVTLKQSASSSITGSGKRSKKLEGFTLSLDSPKGIMVWTARLGKTILVNDVSMDDRYVPSLLPPKNTHSELCSPFWSRRMAATFL